ARRPRLLARGRRRAGRHPHAHALPRGAPRRAHGHPHGLHPRHRARRGRDGAPPLRRALRAAVGPQPGQAHRGPPHAHLQLHPAALPVPAASGVGGGVPPLLLRLQRLHRSARVEPPPVPPTMKTIIESKGLRVAFGQKEVLHGVDLAIPEAEITAIIGPSGCGKSTFLRALNLMHDLTPSARITGEVVFDGRNIYDPGVDPVDLRRRIGMVFQKPNPFPTMSVFDNVAFGPRLLGLTRDEVHKRVEESLKKAAIWEETKDRLRAPATDLSGGQQQRLCIARALAVKPEILLLDEPTSALDPIATAKIEDLLGELKKEVTVVIVTHNMQQAARASDNTAYFLNGDLVEHGPTERLFENPKDERTEAYITGRFG